MTPKLDMTGGDYTLTDNTASFTRHATIGILNLRIIDMMTQLNAVMKTMMEENTALKKENAELKAKQEKTNKS